MRIRMVDYAKELLNPDIPSQHRKITKGCNGAGESGGWQWLLNRARPLNPVVRRTEMKDLDPYSHRQQTKNKTQRMQHCSVGFAW